MDCAYYTQHLCRSCTWLPMPYAEHVTTKERTVREVLGDRAATTLWLPTQTSPREGFRTRARMAVGGQPRDVTLGHLDSSLNGVDLRECLLYAPTIHDAIPVVAQWLNDVHILPYSVVKKRGELKYVVFTSTPDRELALRLVLRSDVWVDRLRAALPDLLDALPHLRVVTVNLLPEHSALPEGDVEIPLTDDTMLAVRVTDVTLFTQPGSFQQTNTEVAGALYRQAREWVEGLNDVRTTWDLYCGVGGFALHAVGSHRHVTGVELGDDAVACARRGAALLAELHAETLVTAGAAVPPETEQSGPSDTATGHNAERLTIATEPAATFVCADATEWARRQDTAPDLVIVNPPRRGLGADLAAWLESSTVPHIIYTSCNAATLAADLAHMPSLTVREARIFDMFPNTELAEVMVLLHREQ